MSSGGERGDGHVRFNLPEGRVLPLNSRRLKAEYIKAIASNMDLPTRASIDEVRQVIEGKLSESGREPRNVQVVIQEPKEGTESDAHTPSVRLFLLNEGGVFQEIETERGHAQMEASDEAATAHAQQEAEGQSPEREDEELEDVRIELQRKSEELEEVTQKLDEAVVEIDCLKREVQQEEEQYKQLWRMNCVNLAEHDAGLAAKDEEIASLHQQLRKNRGEPRVDSSSQVGDAIREARVHVPDTGSGRYHTREPLASPLLGGAHEFSGTGRDGQPGMQPPTNVGRVQRRQGKAPPVDPFTGYDPEVRFEDWLPALIRAAEWNLWTSEGSLMQMAGHLRGHALQATGR